MDTSQEAITLALQALNQKIEELELSIDVEEHFLTQYKKYVTEAALLAAYLKVQSES
jgi:hypothetical protein